jgi:hypothetical protein
MGSRRNSGIRNDDWDMWGVKAWIERVHGCGVHKRGHKIIWDWQWEGNYPLS